MRRGARLGAALALSLILALSGLASLHHALSHVRQAVDAPVVKVFEPPDHGRWCPTCLGFSGTVGGMPGRAGPEIPPLVSALVFAAGDMLPRRFFSLGFFSRAPPALL